MNSIFIDYISQNLVFGVCRISSVGPSVHPSVGPPVGLELFFFFFLSALVFNNECVNFN